MPEQSDTAWFALYVRSRHEKSVHAQLEAKADESYLPLYCAKHKWADRWKTVSLPLFPGYVFCRFEGSRRSAVLATSGVIDVVRVGPEPAAVAASEIEAIRRVLRSQLSAEPYDDLVRGDQVRMSDGPLKGLTGTLMEVRSSLRLVISVDLLHRSVLVEIDRDWVVPSRPSPPACFKLPSQSWA
jgi:transcription antitermination factor NusG